MTPPRESSDAAAAEAGSNDDASASAANEVRPIDGTSERRIQLHEAAYPGHAVSYQQAFDLAIPAVLFSEEGESPRAILNSEGSIPKDDLDRKMRELVAAGSFELLPVDETNVFEEDPAKRWIFDVEVDVENFGKYWVSVDRDTGHTLVSGFN